jgi:hypothetical protein
MRAPRPRYTCSGLDHSRWSARGGWCGGLTACSGLLPLQNDLCSGYRYAGHSPCRCGGCKGMGG